MPSRASAVLAALLTSSPLLLASGPSQAETRPRREPAQYSPASCIIAGPYDDVAISHPLCPFIRDLKLDGITGGCGGAKFCPDDPITRGQLAMFLERVMRGASSWDAWTDGPASPSGLNWGAKTTSSSIGTMMEYSLSAGLESGIYFDDESVILWAPGGTGLVRIFDRTQDIDDEVLRISDGSLSFRPAGLNGTGGDSSVTLKFFDDGAEGNETLRWDNGQDRFEISNDLGLTEDDTVKIIQTATNGQLDVETTTDMSLMVDSDNDSGIFEALLGVYRNGNYTLSDLIARLSETGDLTVRGDVTANGLDLAESYLKSAPTEPGDLVRIDPRRANAVVRARQDDGGAILGVVSTRPGVVLGGGAMDRRSLAAWGADVAARYDSERPGLREALLRETPETGRRQAALAERASALPLVAAAERPRVARELRERQDRLESRIEEETLSRFVARHFAPVALAGRVPVHVDASFGAIQVGDPLAASPTPGVAMLASRPGPIIGTALESWAAGEGKVTAFIDRGWWGGGGSARPAPATDQARDSTIANPAEPRGGPGGVAAAQDSETVHVRGTGHAERMTVSDTVEPGDVLVMDEGDALRPSQDADDAKVVGVAAAQPGIVAGPENRARVTADVVVAGVAWMKVDAGYGQVARGDLLVTSPTRGHAMRADDPRPGTVVAKALDSLESGAGTIRVLVMLR